MVRSRVITFVFSIIQEEWRQGEEVWKRKRRRDGRGLENHSTIQGAFGLMDEKRERERAMSEGRKPCFLSFLLLDSNHKNEGRKGDGGQGQSGGCNLHVYIYVRYFE